MLSGTAEYALRAVVYLARHQEDRPVRTGDLARELGVPKNYLSKVLNALVRGGVLRSSRGRLGGFQLAVPPAELPLIRVVSLFDAIGERRRCLLGRPECSDLHPCPMHQRWKATAERISSFFRETTVADVLGDELKASA